MLLLPRMLLSVLVHTYSGYHSASITVWCLGDLGAWVGLHLEIGTRLENLGLNLGVSLKSKYALNSV